MVVIELLSLMVTSLAEMLTFSDDSVTSTASTIIITEMLDHESGLEESPD